MADETGADDVVELGDNQRFRLPGWRPSRGAQVLAAAALVVGLVAGYIAGGGQGHGATARPRPTVTVTASPSAPAPSTSFPVADSQALTQDTGACSVQTGKNDLELGIRLTNQSTQPLTLTTVRAMLPLGGLKQVAWAWGTCGAINAVPGPVADLLLPGQSVWLTITFRVRLHCPGPLPVQVDVGYRQHGHPFTASLPGFADLSLVPYTGCAATS